MLPSLSFICRFIVPALWTLLGFRSLARILLFPSARRDPIEASSNGRVYDRSLDPRRWRGMSRIVRFRGFGERRRTGYAPTPTLGDDGGRRPWPPSSTPARSQSGRYVPFLIPLDTHPRQSYLALPNFPRVSFARCDATSLFRPTRTFPPPSNLPSFQG